MNKSDFDTLYPYVSSWIYTTGWIELGPDEHSSSMVRILYEGGMVWEDETSNLLHEALTCAEEYLKNQLLEDFGFELEIGDTE